MRLRARWSMGIAALRHSWHITFASGNDPLPMQRSFPQVEQGTWRAMGGLVSRYANGPGLSHTWRNGAGAVLTDGDQTVGVFLLLLLCGHRSVYEATNAGGSADSGDDVCSWAYGAASEGQHDVFGANLAVSRHQCLGQSTAEELTGFIAEPFHGFQGKAFVHYGHGITRLPRSSPVCPVMRWPVRAGLRWSLVPSPRSPLH